MTIDLRSRNFQIELQNAAGGNALDVSSVLKSFTVSNSQLDESGLILATGTLTLHAFPLTPLSESLNPKLNPSRFARKCRVSVQIGDESGNLVTHPRGLLRILKTPKVPSRTNPEIQIQVGCLLSLQDYRQPASDDSGVIPGEPKTRTEIINALAALAKCPDLEDAITAFPIDYPLPRLNGSYVQQMGAIAFAAGYCLWIDNQERLRAKKIPQKPNPVITLRVGRDDNIHEPLEGSETPCEIIYCTCTYPKCLPVVDPPDTISISRDDNYSPSDITIQKWRQTATNAPFSYRRSRQPRGLVMPDAYPDSPFLTNAEEEYSIDLFEDNERGFLLRRRTLIYQPIGAVMPQFYPGDLSSVLASKTEIFFGYEDDIPVRITSYVYEPQGVIDPTNTASESRALPGLSSWTMEEYRKVNNGWTKTIKSRSFKVGNSSPSSSSSFSSAGANQPASPEQCQQLYYLEDTQVTGKCRYSEIGGVFDERKRTFEVQTASTREQLDFLAALIGQRVWGQVNGVSFGLDLRDEFNGDDYEPLLCVDWVEIDDATGNTIKSRYLVTGEAFALSQRQCAIAADGLNLGVVSESGILDRPYQTKGESTGALILTGGFNAYPYALTNTEESFSGTLLLRGGFTEGGGDTPAHFYPLDTTAWEDTAGTSDLTASGTVAVVEGAAEFDGSSYLYTTDEANFDFINQNWKITLSVWFSEESLGYPGVAESAEQWELFYYAGGGGGIYFDVVDASGLTTTAYLGTELATETWISFEISKTGSAYKLKVGAEENTISLSEPLGTPSSFELRFGYGDGEISENSRLDDISVYFY